MNDEEDFEEEEDECEGYISLPLWAAVLIGIMLLIFVIALVIRSTHRPPDPVERADLAHVEGA